MSHAMQPISDEDLVLFHYRDELSRERMQEIEDALFYDAGLRLRLAAVRETLSATGEAWPQPEADAGLEARVWERLAPALPKRVPPAAPSWLDWRSWFSFPRNSQVAFASLLVAAVGIGYLLGRPATPPRDALLAEDASRRVLAAYLAAHLEDTERALMVASNSPGDGEAASELAASLLDTNRLYALAAERAGKPALGQFLRELEPVLIELANEEGAIADGLGDEIRRRDLTYKTRAAAAALASNDAAPPPARQSL